MPFKHIRKHLKTIPELKTHDRGLHLWSILHVSVLLTMVLSSASLILLRAYPNIVKCCQNTWPSLLKIPQFLLEFITPIVKVPNKKANNVLYFYTMPEYNAWKDNLGHRATNFKIKYYRKCEMCRLCGNMCYQWAHSKIEHTSSIEIETLGRTHVTAAFFHSELRNPHTLDRRATFTVRMNHHCFSKL